MFEVYEFAADRTEANFEYNKSFEHPMNDVVKVCASIRLVCLDRRIKKFKRLLVDDWYVQCSTERDDGIGRIPQMREKTTTQDYQSWMYSV